MSKLMIIILIISIIGNAAGVFVLWKAVGYRSAANEYLDKINKSAQNYSKWNHYRNSNKSINLEKRQQDDVIFLGASITEEWNLKDAFPALNVLNRGIYGNKIGGYLLRFKSDVIDLNPRAVVIKICSINFRPFGSIANEEMTDYIESMVSLAKCNNIIPILATTVPIRKNGEQYGAYSVRDNVIAYNSWIKSFCDKEGLHCIDYFTALADESGYLPEKYSRDIIHPNEEGYKVMKSEAMDILDEISGK